MKTNTQPRPASPAYVALCNERDALEKAFKQTLLARLVQASINAEVAWIKGTASREELDAADNALLACAERNPAAAWLFSRLCNVNLQIKQHRVALGLSSEEAQP